MAHTAYIIGAERLFYIVQGTGTRHQKKPRLFPAPGPLELLAMDILGPLPKSKSGNQHVIALKDHFMQITRAVPVATVVSTSAATELTYIWVMPYCTLTAILTERERQLVSKFFAAPYRAIEN